MALNTQWFLALTVAAVIFVLMLLTGYRKRLRRQQAGCIRLRLSLRLLTVAVLLLLAWQILLNHKVQQDDPDAAASAVQLNILIDHSLSMDFKAGLVSSRGALAAKVRHLLQQQLAAEYPGTVQLQEWIFAANIVPADQAELLQRDGTALTSALMSTTRRSAAQISLLLTDGASTEGLLPSYLLEYEASRGHKIYAVCCDNPQARLYDVVLRNVRCRPTNPTHITVDLSCLGTYEEPVTMEFSLNGSLRERRTAVLKQNQSFTFALSGLDRGWHEFTIEAVAGAAERTDLNNTRKGIFEITTNRILFLSKRPRLENTVLIRTLNRLFPGEVRMLAISSAESANLQPGDYALVICGDIPSTDLPPAFLKHQEPPPLLVLPGVHFDSWHAGAVPGFPIQSHQNIVQLSTEKSLGKLRYQTPMHVEVRNTAIATPLPLEAYYAVRATESATELVLFDSNGTDIPLLLGDAGTMPRLAALLTDVTWKWSRSPQLQVRTAYEQFWTHTVNSFLDTATQEPLRLTVAETQSKTGEILVQITSDVDIQTLENVELLIWADGREHRVIPQRQTETLVHFLANPASRRPAVVWLQAVAEKQGEKLRSTKRPVLFEHHTTELLQTDANPELLRNLVGESNFAFAEDAETIIQRILEDLHGSQLAEKIRERNNKAELLLAAVLFVLLAVVWCIERQQTKPPEQVQ